MAIETKDVTQALYDTSKRLDKGADIITVKAKEYAQSEKTYRIALAKEMARLRANGTPTTLINNLARGDENVADLKFNRDLSQEVLKASHSMLRALETETSALQSVLKVQSEI